MGAFRLSPDGRYLVFVSKSKLWVRPLDALEPKALDGTEDASYPFWSPDGENVGFFAGGNLKRTPRSGGLVQTLCEAVSARGGTWNRDGVIVFSVGPASVSLLRVSAAGGTPVAVSSAKVGVTRGLRYPEFLPDGQHFLDQFNSAQPDKAGIYAGGLDGSEVRLLPDESNAVFAAAGDAGSGLLLFRRSGTLMAQPFDTTRLKLTGDVFPVAERVGQPANVNTAFGAFTASMDGTLVFGSGSLSGVGQLVWMDRTGRRLGVVTEPFLWDGNPPRISPNGSIVAYRVGDNSTNAIWLQGMTKIGAAGNP